MKVTVIGGTGVAGRWTAEALRAQGHEVIVAALGRG
jgi:nucleoside-diphosphate-sugar epimerase